MARITKTLYIKVHSINYIYHVYQWILVLGDNPFRLGKFCAKHDTKCISDMLYILTCVIWQWARTSESCQWFRWVQFQIPFAADGRGQSANRKTALKKQTAIWKTFIKGSVCDEKDMRKFIYFQSGCHKELSSFKGIVESISLIVCLEGNREFLIYFWYDANYKRNIKKNSNLKTKIKGKKMSVLVSTVVVG